MVRWMVSYESTEKFNELKRQMFPYGNVFHLLKTGRMTLNGNCHEPNLLAVLIRNH